MKTYCVIPYIDKDKELAEIYGQRQQFLAGVECEVVLVHDDLKIGWPNVHNKMANTLDFDYYCYSCADYEPGDNFLKLAIDKLKETGAGLCAFNDGKWDGKIASVGVVTREYYNNHGLFAACYKSHGADDEITNKAKHLGLYTYEPLAILEEVNGRKEPENKQYNKEDQELYANRCSNPNLW